MTQYDNNMRGVLFKNDRKTDEKHPDYKGQAEVDGVEYWMSAWIREGTKGKFMSISYEAKEPKPTHQQAAPKSVQKARNFDDPPF